MWNANFDEDLELLAVILICRQHDLNDGCQLIYSMQHLFNKLLSPAQLFIVGWAATNLYSSSGTQCVQLSDIYFDTITDYFLFLRGTSPDLYASSGDQCLQLSDIYPNTIANYLFFVRGTTSDLYASPGDQCLQLSYIYLYAITNYFLVLRGTSSYLHSSSSPEHIERNNLHFDAIADSFLFIRGTTLRLHTSTGSQYFEFGDLHFNAFADYFFLIRGPSSHLYTSSSPEHLYAEYVEWHYVYLDTLSILFFAQLVQLVVTPAPRCTNGIETDADGVQYEVQCGSDTTGGTQGTPYGTSSRTTSYKDCFAVCDDTPLCQGFVWVGAPGSYGNGPGTCYFKGTGEPDQTITFEQTNDSGRFHVCGRAPNLYTTCRNNDHNDYYHCEHVFIELGRVSAHLLTSGTANYDYNHHHDFYEFYEFVIRGAACLYSASTADNYDDYNYNKLKQYYPTCQGFVFVGATDSYGSGAGDCYFKGADPGQTIAFTNSDSAHFAAIKVNQNGPPVYPITTTTTTTTTSSSSSVDIFVPTTTTTTTTTTTSSSSSSTITSRVIYTPPPPSQISTSVSSTTSITFTSQPARLSCARQGYLVQNFNWFVVEIATGNTVQNGSIQGGVPMQAMGYNRCDGLIYATDQEAHLVRFGLDLNPQRLYEQTFFRYQTGEVDNDCQYWAIRTADNDVARWIHVDVNPASPVYGTIVGQGELAVPQYFYADWAYVPGAGSYLWSVGIDQPTGYAYLYRFDQATLTSIIVASFGDIGLTGWIPDPASGYRLNFGAVYASADGFLYGSENISGNIYRFTVTEPYNWQFLVQGPGTVQNDGARCIDNTEAIGTY
ncbi:hypothetical protein KC343_g2282 [Hortaea werneckii]|nr:hypothetical protein KC352_g13091 [Hortaea werneckii]KAI7567987.1 hypothetical protein KC317_g4595 [Hortaea werneckii]KAI7624171.1 hypothetical protein KC346_g2337 [Hortaea werneckii]KAI7634639.1 hypothetical protein KC343_g2282 [Hortaea werneckii]KAI7676951.1 hypothetical protein KC319_g4179 [Hortaea werneckii]